MNLLSAISNALNGGKGEMPPFFMNAHGVALYSPGKEDVYLNKGYKKNAWLYAIVSKSSRKFAQVPWYHYRIKTNERKTWGEYLALTKGGISDAKAKNEAVKMRKKSIDQLKIDSPLQAFLNHPNNYQSGAQFREQLYGYRELSGEGNTWFARPVGPDGRADVSQAPSGMFLIPRSALALIPGVGPWDVKEIELLLAGQMFRNPKENVLIWKYPCYDFNALTLAHLRGQSPLDAGLLTIQGLNEGAETLVTMNKNRGAAGLATSEDLELNDLVASPARASFIRRQFNSIVNDSELAGSIAVMAGKWNYQQFGLDAQKLQLIEQTNMQFQSLCNIYDVPWQLFGNSDSYENRKQYKRDLIYDKIAPDCYSLRDEWNATLVPEFQLDPSVDVVDCDVMALPELAEDLKSRVDAITKAPLSPNEQREFLGWGRIEGTEGMDDIYLPGSLRSVQDMNSDTGVPLDNELSQLGQ